MLVGKSVVDAHVSEVLLNVLVEETLDLRVVILRVNKHRTDIGFDDIGKALWRSTYRGLVV